MCSWYHSWTSYSGEMFFYGFIKQFIILMLHILYYLNINWVYMVVQLTVGLLITSIPTVNMANKVSSYPMVSTPENLILITAWCHFHTMHLILKNWKSLHQLKSLAKIIGVFSAQCTGWNYFDFCQQCYFCSNWYQCNYVWRWSLYVHLFRFLWFTSRRLFWCSWRWSFSTLFR